MLLIINNYKQNPDLPQMKRIKNKKDFILKTLYIQEGIQNIKQTTLV